jgi:hypothetical protein
VDQQHDDWLAKPVSVYVFIFWFQILESKHRDTKTGLAGVNIHLNRGGWQVMQISLFERCET